MQRLQESDSLELQLLRMVLRDHPAVVGKLSVYELRHEYYVAKLEFGLSRGQFDRDRIIAVLKELGEFDNRLAGKYHFLLGQILPPDVAARVDRKRTRLNSSPDQISYAVCCLKKKKRRVGDRKSTRLNSSHDQISYAVFCLKKKQNADSAVCRHHTTSEPQCDDQRDIDNHSQQ